MTKHMTINVRVGGELREHVAEKIGEYGRYDNVSEYVRDLIRHDLEREAAQRFESLKAELQKAFAVPIEDCVEFDVEDMIARNRARRG
jgi:antitoxin ParD1/3/4